MTKMIIAPMFWKDRRRGGERVSRRDRALAAAMRGDPLPEPYVLQPIGKSAYVLSVPHVPRREPRATDRQRAAKEVLGFARTFVDYLGERLGGDRALAALRLLSRIPELRDLAPPKKSQRRSRSR